MNMEKLKNRKERFEYVGKLEEYQLTPKKLTMEYEIDHYSSYQNYLYKRALYGLSAISESELATMCSKKKQRITNVYKRVQSVLNILKQKVTIKYTNDLFKALFPKSPWTDEMLAYTEVDERFTNTLTFKDLNISKQDIITIFISEGILPKNFLSLKEAPVTLPRLKTKENENIL